MNQAEKTFDSLATAMGLKKVEGVESTLEKLRELRRPGKMRPVACEICGDGPHFPKPGWNVPDGWVVDCNQSESYPDLTRWGQAYYCPECWRRWGSRGARPAVQSATVIVEDARTAAKLLGEK